MILPSLVERKRRLSCQTRFVNAPADLPDGHLLVRALLHRLEVGVVGLRGLIKSINGLAFFDFAFDGIHVPLNTFVLHFLCIYAQKSLASKSVQIILLILQRGHRLVVQSRSRKLTGAILS